ncbi:MAG: Shikimate dehydrogenase (NADP(+)) [Burkholderiaceae bacterium]|nr:Shikimate dehydrogenase (NADP(+)) [Burkholderiaceae bacterium]
MSAAAQPERYAVVGNPVAHSRSPFIHAAFARQTGEALEYSRLLCPLDGFAASVQAFATSSAPGKGPARGCNVTVPFKLQAPTLASRVSARAALAQAANLLRFDDAGWFADNTDGIGLVRDIESHAGFAIAGARVLLVGAGGAAAGVLGPLIEAGPREIVVANRTRENAQALVARHRRLAGALPLAARGLTDCGEAFDLVINSSSSSMQGLASPVPGSALSRGSLAIDLMYGAAAEPFLQWARAAGARARDGLGMLVEQAAEAFFVWRGVRPQTPPVLRALREQLAREAA